MSEGDVNKNIRKNQGIRDDYSDCSFARIL